MARSLPVTVTRRVRFSAARQVSSRALDDVGNERLFGADRELHGREFALFVTLSGDAPPETGMIMDLKALSRLLKAEIVAELDHKLLNRCALVEGVPPTTENLAIAIWRAIEPKLPPGLLAEVAVREGDDKAAIYRGEE